MAVGEYCNRKVVIVSKTDTLQETISLMRSEHVGTVVVVERSNGNIIPIGILTDRDIVIEILAEDIKPESINVGDVMSLELVVVNEAIDLMDVVKIMRIKGVKRIPIVNNDGGLVGILAVDDVLELLAEQMMDLAKLASVEQSQEITKTHTP